MMSARPDPAPRLATLPRALSLWAGLAMGVGAPACPIARGAEQTVTEADMPSPADRDPVSALSEGEFALRSHSTMHLWENRDRWGEAVAAACRSSDPEVAGRARWVRARWKRGILPGVPDDLIAVLSAATPTEAIEFLLQAGQFDAAVVAMEEASATLDHQAMTQRAALLMDTQFPLYVRLADQSGQSKAFQRFLNVACNTKELAACRVQWMQVMGVPVTDDNRLPACARSWPEPQRHETLCLIYLIEGDFERAEELATKRETETPPGRRSLRRVIRMLTGQWERVAEEAVLAAEHAMRRAEQSDRGGPNAQADTAEAPAEEATDAVADGDRWRLHAVRHWNDVLLAASRCNREDLRDRAVKALGSPMTTPSTEPSQSEPSDAETQRASNADRQTASTLRWRGLMVHGYVDAALPIAQSTDRREWSSLLAALSRFDDALDSLDRPASRIDVELETWIDNALLAQEQLNDSLRRDTRLASEMDDLLVLMRLLLRIGREEDAFRIVRRMSDDQVLAGVARARDHVLHRLIGTRRSDWAFDLAMLPGETQEPRGLTLRVLTPGLVVQDERLLPAISTALALDHPEWTPRRRFRTACRLASSESASDSSATHFLVSLSRRLADGTLHEAMQPQDLQIRGQGEMLPMPSSSSWVALFEAHGRADLARPLLAEAAADGDPESMKKLAELQQQAAPLSRRRWPAAPSSGTFDDRVDSVWTPLIQAPNRHDVMVGVEVLIEYWETARSQGDRATADRLMRQIRQMACTPSTDMRQQIADRLAEAGEVETAENLFQSLLYTTGMNSDETMAFIDIARAHYRLTTQYISPPEADAVETLHRGLEDPPPSSGSVDAVDPRRRATTLQNLQKRRRALQWFDLAFSGTLESSDYRESTYVTLPLFIVHERLEIAAETLLYHPPDESPELVRQIDRDLRRAMQFDPIDITVGERSLPRLRQRGLAAMADETFDRIFAAGKRHTRHFPRDSMTANNVAWSAAMNGRHLPEALELARRAVATEPDSAIYRDTLAELLAMTGQPRQAAQIERACVLDDPGQWHLHQQIRRFDAMASESEPTNQ